MSHELRTPLNSMLILSRLLRDNSEKNLTAKQVEYAETIHGAGSDLLALINETLDLSKMEAGAMQIEIGEVSLADIQDFIEKSFRHVTEEKQLAFEVGMGSDLPATMVTARRRI